MSLISSISGIGQSFFGARPNEIQNLRKSAEAGQVAELRQAHAADKAAIMNGTRAISATELRGVEGIRLDPYTGIGAAAPAEAKGAPSFGSMLSDLVEAVDRKGEVSREEAVKLMTGESDNIHQSVIAMREAGVAFDLLIETRNKLTESYQELMRMQV